MPVFNLKVNRATRLTLTLSGLDMTPESALQHFIELGAKGYQRRVYNGREHFGLQLRCTDTTDADLYLLEYLQDDIDVIGLEGTRITDNGLNHLPQLRFLYNIDLTNTAITDDGLAILSKIKTLEYIHVEGTKISKNGLLNLINELPNCEFISDFGDELD